MSDEVVMTNATQEELQEMCAPPKPSEKSKRAKKVQPPVIAEAQSVEVPTGFRKASKEVLKARRMKALKSRRLGVPAPPAPTGSVHASLVRVAPAPKQRGVGNKERKRR